jgi:two-component system sensor histidine kinase AlgZ
MRRRLPILLLAVALLLGTFLAGAFFHGDLPLWRILRLVLIHAGIYGLVLGTIMPRLGPRLLVLPAPRGLAALVLTLVLLSAFASFAIGALLHIIEPARSLPFWRGFAIRVAIGSLVSCIVGTVIAMYARFENQMDQISQTLRTRDQEKEHALKIAREMRLSLLESHLHPHFLFNTLASIATLIPEAPDRAQKMVWSLSALFRSAINMTAHRLIPLGEEWRLMLSYLEIQKERLGDRLSYTAKMAEDVSSVPVPAFSIQTLVENSLKHAIEPRLNGGTVRIDAYRQGGKLILDVIDDGPGFPENPLLSGSGLNNLQSRLALLFGGEAQLIIDSGAQGASVRLNIPCLPPKAPYDEQ